MEFKTLLIGTEVYLKIEEMTRREKFGFEHFHTDFK